MFYTVGVLVVLVILFELCSTQEKAMDVELEFWIKARQVLDHSK